MGRRPCFSRDGLYKGPWTSEEDFLLIKYIHAHGVGKWRSLPKNAGLNRCGKSCRFRWMNYLRPGIKRGDFSAEEEELIIRLHSLLGNRWSLIARRMPGRTDNEVKNYWNTHLRKRFKQSTANELINGDQGNEIHILNHNNSNAIGLGISNSSNGTFMESHDTAMAATQCDFNEALGDEGYWNDQRALSSTGLESSYCINQDYPCISSYNWACDQFIVGVDWSIGDSEAFLFGYDSGTAHAFLY
ncbi:hypothetical protein KI387_013826 [Taxus chinensis]|uniref:Uncharacterized protein n=1 Tax=Taxus chinensis TaxID=29808 RepID=A0AA38FGW9_TAXCH|nr:hypothetical protein KI387_013826 [Taxus chinensis]